MRISPGRVVKGVRLNKNSILKKSQKCQKLCLYKLNKNCFKTRLWDDSGTILYVYNLLGYRETLSDKSGTSQTIQNSLFVFQKSDICFL